MTNQTIEKQKLLNQETLMSVVIYDKDTGSFSWRVKGPHRSMRVGGAGFLNTDGYRYLGIKDKRYKEHRLAWLYVYGQWPDGQIDHINGIRNDNRISNLRVVTQRQNNTNQETQRNGRLPGCYYDKRWGKWHAQIVWGDQHMYLGSFTTEKEASEAYLKQETFLTQNEQLKKENTQLREKVERQKAALLACRETLTGIANIKPEDYSHDEHEYLLWSQNRARFILSRIEGEKAVEG